MVEILAAVSGASITLAGIGISGLNRQNQQDRVSMIRLATAVENLTSRLDELHADIKNKDAEVFARLGSAEQSIARLEGHANRN